MRLIKKAVFWVHLAAGLLAGAVILVLGITGVVMSFERQILESSTGVSVKPSAAQISPETILSAQAGAKPAATGVTFNSDPEKPAVVQFGRGKSLFVDPATGASLGEGNVQVKKFFAWVLTLHRWLTLEGTSREVGKNVTGVANLVFLFLVVSGLYLWFPKRWTKSGLKAITRIQWRLKGRARDWNWHNVFGFWACVPLFFIVVTGAVMSYTWAGNLIYKAVGENPPAPRQGGGGPGAAAMAGGEQGGERRAPRPEGSAGERPVVSREGGERRGPRPEGTGAEGRPRGGAEGRRGGEEHAHSHDEAPVSLAGLDAGFAAVKAANAEWKTIQVSPPKGTTAQFSVSTSHRGRPDLRRTLTVDLASGAVVKNEGFESQTTGRKVRTFVRWIHTGEAFGWPGQLLMGLAALSAVVLVWTGFALSWRRFFKKRRVAVARTEVNRAAA